MMKEAIVYYVDLDEEARKELHEKGWNSPIGDAYLDARMFGIYDAAVEFGLVKVTAAVEVPEEVGDDFFLAAEEVWKIMQNLDKPWTKKSEVNRVASGVFPRSMDVGDLILFIDDHGYSYRVSSFGFERMNSRRIWGPGPWCPNEDE